MGKAKTIITIAVVFTLLFSYESISGNIETKFPQTDPKTVQSKAKTTQTDPKTVQTKAKTAQTGTKTVQTKTKSAQTGSKTTQTKSKSVQKSPKTEPATMKKDVGTVTIGTQTWAVANLNVSTFRNGDSIPEARTNKEWQTAGELGKPAWCYYNNDPAHGSKYGKLYNWYALNDPRELAPAGWTLSGDADWAKLSYFLGGEEVAGRKLKSTGEWIDGNIGTNETGFMGFPGGYRVENGTFLNFGSIGTWWSSTENKSLNAIDHYLAQSNIFGRSSSPKQRGESVRCIKK